jgi:hypothetical protein
VNPANPVTTVIRDMAELATANVLLVESFLQSPMEAWAVIRLPIETIVIQRTNWMFKIAFGY